MHPAVLLTDSSFGPGNSSEATLCIEVGDGSLRFCMVRNADAYCYRLEDYGSELFPDGGTFETQLEKLVKEHAFLRRKEWAGIYLSVNLGDFTLVPSALFRGAYVGEYLKMVLGHTDLPGKEVCAEKIPLPQVYSVFTIYEKWKKIIQDFYPTEKLKFSHSTSSAITGALLSHQTYGERKVVSLYVEDDFFQMVVSENKELLFCNRFYFSGQQEFTYLVLVTLNQLNFLPEDVKVYLYGEITPFSENYKELCQFIPDLYFGKRPTRLTYCASFEDVPDHRFSTLLNSYLVNL